MVCDAHTTRPIRLITHAHSDHISGIKESLSECQWVIATPITKELIGVLKGKEASEPIKALDYKHPFDYQKERLTLYPADHIIGSAQVLVEDAEGKRIVYTGDFKLPGATIIPSDILVIEATYGNPKHVRWFKEVIEAEFVNLVENSLKERSVYIFGYHGKLQEVIRILNDFDVDVPIIVPHRILEIVRICNNHGMELRNCFSSKSKEGMEIRKATHIGVYHVGASRWVGRDAVRIFLSGWQFDVPCKKVGEYEYRVALSDHSDFEQLMEYVEKSKPSLVITDNHRVGDAPALAREIKNRLGIEAIPMP